MIYAVILFMFLTLAVLVAGLVSMAAGGKSEGVRSNRLMVLRVAFQALAIGSLFLMYAFSS